MNMANDSRARAKEAGKRWAHPPPGEEVVISGLSGRFPDSDNVYEFRDKLFDKIDLVSDDDRRWKIDHPEIPQRTGKIKHISKFDASYFGLHYKQVQTMDPMGRLLLERAYEAIVDAGINPSHLRGKRCGVFIGACFSESERTWFNEKLNVNGFGITGSSRTMLANRISYWLGVEGPSYTVDSACSSSLYAIEQAYQSIRDGHCDMALVGSSNLCLHPYVSLQFFRLGVLSTDGACKSFDNSANGYCRSEAIPMIFIQRARVAKRIYATIVHTKTNCDGYKEQGITYPSGQMQYELLKEFYEECNIDPSTVDFIEAHGTGTKVGDPEECNALDKIFCNGRKSPLLIGSIKSNIGHTEPASGLCSIAKAIIAMESGYIPPNLHFKTPRDGIPAFPEGRLKVVTEKEPFTGYTIGVNSFGFGGANCHILLKRHEKEKINGGLPQDDLPRLVVVSGRTEEAVSVILDDLETNPVDVECIKLYHDLYSENIDGHLYRGYTILSTVGKRIRDIKHYSEEKTTVCFAFSGLGSQWPKMGHPLMKLPIFASTIDKCHNILQPLGLNLKKILLEDDSKWIQNILPSSVAIVAMQIGLIDLLHSLGLYPDYIVGYAFGDVACAYADGCLTIEQAILTAYYIGLSFKETNIPRGAMMIVDMPLLTLNQIIPEDIDIAIQNGLNACIISGPVDSVERFSYELDRQGVPVKKLSCFNIPLHSRYVARVEGKLLNYLKKIIQTPKLRTDKWLDSTYRKRFGDLLLNRLCTPDYLVNSFLRPVNFKERCPQISDNVSVVEITPDVLLEYNFKKYLSDSIQNVILTERYHPNNIETMLSCIGKLYENGCQPQIAYLYPAVEYPVSKGTRMISPFVRWEHSQDWHITFFRMHEKIKTGERSVTINLKDEDFEYLSGHVIDGRTLFPATGYLVLVWETLAMMVGQFYKELPVIFENVKFIRATPLQKDRDVEFTIMIQKASGKFEIIEGGTLIVHGNIQLIEDNDEKFLNLPELTPVEGKDLITLNAKDIYKELRLRGYHYKGLFRGLVALDNVGQTGKIKPTSNYVAFMDSLLQTQILQEDTRSLYVPTRIRKLCINPFKHQNYIDKCSDEENKTMNVSIYKNLQTIISGGIEIHELRATQISRKKPLGEPVLEKYLFVPHITHDEIKALNLLETIRLCFHIILENVHTIKVKVVELCENLDDLPLFANHIASILGDLPLVQSEILVLGELKSPTEEVASGITIEDRKISSEQNCLAVVGFNLLDSPVLLQQTLKSLKPEGYLISREKPKKILALNEFNVLVDRVVEDERILLLQSKVSAVVPNEEKTKVLKVVEKDGFEWVETLKKHIQNAEIQLIFLVAEKEKTSGLIGLVNCLRREPGGEKIRCVFIFDEDAPEFDLKLPFYDEQLRKGLAVNIYKNGEWGSYRHEALSAGRTTKSEHVYINSENRGDLSSLKLFEGPLNINPGDDEIIIYYASVNFRDVMLASGKLAIDAAIKGRINQELPIGLEFSGRLAKTGVRIMGMTKHGALASKMNSSDCIFWKVPDIWTLQQAASIPVVYETVYSSLVSRGRLQKGESILIHSGTGGVGLAALRVATIFECNIFTTVGTQIKRDYLKELYPQIPDSHIGNSRDTSFEDMIKRETKGRGVDIILNSLSEEKLLASLRCLAEGGRFIEIGKFDLSQDNPIGMENLSKRRSFHAVHLDALFFEKYKKRLYDENEVFEENVGAGKMVPLKTTVYDYSECEQAFRYLTTGKHIGKVLIKFRDEEPEPICIPQKKEFDAVPRLNCSHKKSYIILGGLGGFGLELADWLVMRGAKIIILNSRNGLKTGYQALRIRLWKTYGVHVVISTEDVTTEQGVINLLTEAEKLGPVDAIFNLAVVLRDAIFENQTEESFITSFGPKALATKHLDKVSRKLCSQLEHFVVFSSVSCGRGNAGQTNYGMANSVMERICEIRVEEGFPGLAIQWGAIGEVGLVAEMQEDHQELVIGGTLQQSISSCLKCMDIFLKQNHPIVASMVVAEKKAGVGGGGNIVDAVVNILGIHDFKTISLHSSLAELGMDSMMAVEIKQMLEREFDVYLTAQDIRGLTFAKLKQIASNASEGGGKEKSKLGTQEDLEAKRLEDQKMLFGLLADEETSVLSSVIFEHGEINNALKEKLISSCGKVPPIFFVPGLEGVAETLKPLAKKICCPSLGLQFPYDDEANSSINEVTNRMLKILKSQWVPMFPFIIIGYSTGAIMAVEMAAILEKEFKCVGTLILLDGAPDLLKKAIEFFLGSADDPSLLDAGVLHAIYNLFVPGANLKIKEDLCTHPTWEEKLSFMETVIPEKVIQKKEHQKKMTSDIRRRVIAVNQYNVSGLNKLNSKVILIRPQELFVPTALTNDYNLSELCNNPVEVHFVEGNHLTMLEAPKVAETINEAYREAVSLVSGKITQDFESSITNPRTIKTR